MDKELKMSEWHILDTGEQSAEENMRLDAELLERADSGQGTVRHLAISRVLNAF
jgi:hypothetical protein